MSATGRLRAGGVTSDTLRSGDRQRTDSSARRQIRLSSSTGGHVMLNRSLSLAAGAALLSWGLTACATARAPGAAGADCSCPVPAGAGSAAQSSGIAAAAAAATGPEASTTQGRKSSGVTTVVPLNNSQSGETTAVGTTYDGSATISAGAPAVVQTLFGAVASAASSATGDETTKALSEELAGIRTRALSAVDPAERARLDARADAILATIRELALARNATAATAAAAPPPSFPNLTTVTFVNASGSSAGSDKPAVDPKNGENIATGVPALVKEARAK